MKFLVVASVGDRSRHHGWLGGQESPEFDLWLSYYGEKPGAYRGESAVYREQPGPKWLNLYTLLEQERERLSSYDAVFCPDDDLELEAAQINELFRTVSEFGLSLAQPAFTWDSLARWNVTRQRPYLRLRYTNFVENGATVFSKGALEQCLTTFPRSTTGFGLDLLWAYLLGYPDQGIAVIDSVACRHRGDLSELDSLVLPRQQHQEEGDRLLQGIPWKAVQESGFVLNSNGLELVESGRSLERVRELAERTMRWAMNDALKRSPGSLGFRSGL